MTTPITRRSLPWLALLAGLLVACGRNDSGAGAPPLGVYRGVLSVAGGDLPFGLELARENGALVAYLINGPERARAPDVRLEGDRLEEERRLMYVGITRARRQVVLSWSRVRALYGRETYQMPSGFLMEISRT